MKAATVCPLDCPDACSLEVTIEDGRIASIDGSHANPVTDGYICAKVRRFPERVYGPDRLMYPAILAMYGKMPSVSYEDFEEARLIILWGANPSASGIHLVPHIREAQRRGALLVVVDPRTTALAKQADIHLAVRPGTDLPVALSIHRYLFEEGHADEAFLQAHAHGAERLRERAREWTFERAAAEADIPVEMLRQVAELYATARPALIRCGYGQERNRNGGSASLAILALPAVGGKFGERGGAYMMSNSASWGIANTWTGPQEPATREINMIHLGRTLLE